MNDSGNRCVCGHEKNEHVWIQNSVSKLAFLGRVSLEPLKKDVVHVKNALAGSMRHQANSNHLEMLCIQNDKKLLRNVDVQDVGCYLIIMMM